jgi:leucyl-tRNA synthetase
MHTCVVQVDGKRKFEVEIEKAPREIKGNAERLQWVVQQVSETEQGREWLDRATGRLWTAALGTGAAHPVYDAVPEGWNVVVVKEGQLVNFVSPRKKKVKKEE